MSADEPRTVVVRGSIDRSPGSNRTTRRVLDRSSDRSSDRSLDRRRIGRSDDDPTHGSHARIRRSAIRTSITHRFRPACRLAGATRSSAWPRSHLSST